MSTSANSESSNHAKHVLLPVDNSFPPETTIVSRDNNENSKHFNNGHSPRSEEAQSTTEKSNPKLTSYGWFNFYPQCLQPLFTTRTSFLIIFSLTCILQGTFHTYFVAVITTLEKLFSIPSKTIGTLMAATEIGQVSSSLLLPHFVGTSHRPRWMGLGAGLFSIATLLCASPHILLPPNLQTLGLENHGDEIFHVSNNLTNLSSSSLDPSNSSTTKEFMTNFCFNISAIDCNGNSSSGGSEGDWSNVGGLIEKPETSLIFLYLILGLSLLSIGAGQTAVYILGIPYLDDNIKNKDSPVYFSITIGVRILGPVFGFILGSFCTRLYIYPFSEIPPTINPSSPHWLGAWWLGMVFISITLFITSVLISGFPSGLLSNKNATTKSESTNSTTATTTAKANGSPVNKASSRLDTEEQSVRLLENSTPIPKSEPTESSSFPAALTRLLRNRILVLRTFSSVFHLLPISGLYTFLPKYLENQFQLTAAEANLITGIAGILVMGIGIFGSGFWIRMRGAGARGIAGWVGISAGIYAFGMFVLMFIGCDNDNNNFGSLSSSSAIQTVNLGFREPLCNMSSCVSCNENEFSPICIDGLNYLSPCVAGCTGKIVKNKTVVSYTNCECSISKEQSSALPSLCPISSHCTSSMYLYIGIFMLIVLVHSTSEVGSMLLTLRCVDPKDKAMALGLIQCCIGIFGNVPCPILYGAIVDSSCEIWGTSGASCGDEAGSLGNCWVYDNKSFRWVFHGTTGGLMFIAFLIDCVIWFQADHIQLTDEEPEGPKKETKNKTDDDNDDNHVEMVAIES